MNAYKLAGLLAATLSLTAPAAQAATPVTFAMNAWIGFAPLFVASDKHFFGAYRTNSSIWKPASTPPSYRARSIPPISR